MMTPRTTHCDDIAPGSRNYVFSRDDVCAIADGEACANASAEVAVIECKDATDGSTRIFELLRETWLRRHSETLNRMVSSSTERCCGIAPP